MPRFIVILFTLAWGLGIILGELLSWSLLAGGSVVLLTVGSWTRRGRLVAMMTVALVAGCWRVQTAIAGQAQATDRLIRVESAVTGLVQRATLLDGELTLDLTALHIGERHYVGTGRVTMGDSLTVQAGDRLEVLCRWLAPRDRNLRRWQAQNLVADCRWPEQTRVVGREESWRATLARWRAGLVEKIMSDYHSPQSDLLAGILLGVQETMTEGLRQEFRATGTSHIVALSGFNVTIIITVMAGALSALIGRRLAVAPMMVFVIAFVIMTGASASVTRAAVMAIIALLAVQLGRPVAISRVLAYALVAMTAINPLLLGYDLGFQLSFLATIGLVYCSALLETRLRFIPATFALRSNFATTLGAMVATEPLLLWTFGRLSIVAPLVNLAVLPFIPLIMATGAIGLIVPWAVPVTDALLRLVLGIIGAAAGWPLAQVTPPWWVAALGVSITLALMLHWFYEAAKKTSTDR